MMEDSQLNGGEWMSGRELIEQLGLPPSHSAALPSNESSPVLQGVTEEHVSPSRGFFLPPSQLQALQSQRTPVNHSPVVNGFPPPPPPSFTSPAVTHSRTNFSPIRSNLETLARRNISDTPTAKNNASEMDQLKSLLNHVVSSCSRAGIKFVPELEAELDRALGGESRRSSYFTALEYDEWSENGSPRPSRVESLYVHGTDLYRPLEEEMEDGQVVACGSEDDESATHEDAVSSTSGGVMSSDELIMQLANSLNSRLQGTNQASLFATASSQSESDSDYCTGESSAGEEESVEYLAHISAADARAEFDLPPVLIPDHLAVSPTHTSRELESEASDTTPNASHSNEEARQPPPPPPRNPAAELEQPSPSAESCSSDEEELDDGASERARMLKDAVLVSELEGDASSSDGRSGGYAAIHRKQAGSNESKNDDDEVEGYRSQRQPPPPPPRPTRNTTEEQAEVSSAEIDEWSNDDDPGYTYASYSESEFEQIMELLIQQRIEEEEDNPRDSECLSEREVMQATIRAKNLNVLRALETDEFHEDLLTFDLKVVFRPLRTGFEESKTFSTTPGALIAGRYRVQETMGQAAFSTAYHCEDVQTQVNGGPLPVCLKVVKNNKEYFDQSLDEIKLLHHLNSSGDPDKNYILRMFDYFYYKEHLFIVSELLKENLYEFGKFIRESGDIEPYFTLSTVRRIAKQVLTALQFVHSLGLVHCDVKPENIVMSSYSRCEVKLIDFGSSCYLTDKLSTYIQSRSYRAPEVIFGCPYDGRIDVWSLGCVLAEIFTGYVLFQNDSVQTMLARIKSVLGEFPKRLIECGKDSHKFVTPEGDVYERVRVESSDDTQNNYRYFLFKPKQTSLRQRLHTMDDQFVDFISSLLTLDPIDRPTSEEALGHPWLAVEEEGNLPNIDW